MDFAVRQESSVCAGHLARGAHHKCPQCRESALVLQRRHVSPARLGAPLVTEYYDCDCCDARFTFSPAENSWRPLYS